jgi:hypothetical protein
VKSAVASSCIAEPTVRPGQRENNAKVDSVATADCSFVSCEVTPDIACVLPASADVKISPLEYIDVVIQGNRYKALVDSGAQILLMRASLLSDISYVGHINVQPIIGKPVSAKLAVLDVAKYDCTQHGEPKNVDSQSGPLHLTFGITDLATHDVVLPTDIVKNLQQTSHKSDAFCTDVDLPLMSTMCSDKDEADDGYVDCAPVNVDALITADDLSIVEPIVEPEVHCDSQDFCDVLSISETVNNSSRDALIQEQLHDLTLKSCRSLADRGKGGYTWIDNVLYHRDRVLNQTVLQLCVPKSRRNEILRLAHEKCFHQGCKKTNERIRYCFYWPTLRSDVINYVMSCLPCQQKRRLRIKERVPIQPIERPGLPGEHLMMDIIGPIDPPSSQGHRYLLNIICMHTRWPFAYLLKNLTAKSVCDCLCDVFSYMGVASVVSSDCGTNFVSKLTRYFLDCMGCAPRFNSPFHPEASGAVERLNQSFKRMLHHAITTNSRQWHKCVPFILWALRESGNETTGLPPYTLLYGHSPRGPLHILKESWTGDKPLPPNFNKSETEYMTSLRKHLDVVRSYADNHAEFLQSAYVDDYNKRSTDKSFAINEQVLVLFPDSSNKLLSRWQLGTIVDIYSEYSYLVEFANGARKQVHANHLRPFVVKVNSVIVEHDEDFGGILPVPVSAVESLPSNSLDHKLIAHLSTDQQKELLNLLDEFHVCFSDKPGLLTAVQHDIVTLPDFVPKRLKPYKIPELLKPEVEKQIDSLLRDGFIVPSCSPMISPIVCVVKQGAAVKTGSMQVRIVCDLRYLNKFTQFDPYPVPELDQVLNKLASFRYISLFDAKAGYWQTAVKPDCQWLFGFATHHGLWQWTRTPFGAKNSGSTFIRGIQQVLYPIRDITASYVDDMGVGSHSWPDHLVNLRRFFTVIRDAGVTLNLAKSELAKQHVKFVGHIVGCGTKQADPDKIAAIQLIPRPRTQKELKSFLGMLTYHAMYIPRLAEIAQPLTDLTSPKYGKQLPWSDIHEKAFCALKGQLCSLVALSVPRIGGLFILRCDASGCAVSGCLYQRDDDVIDNVDVSGSGERPLSFFSKKLSPAQCSTTNHE